VLFRSGQFAGFNSITGATITGGTINFQTISGVSGVFTTQISGNTITGDTINSTNLTSVSGIFTTQVSGQTITGNIIRGTSGVFEYLQAANQSFSGDFTFSGNTFTLGSGFFGSGISVTGTVSGQTITGTAGLFTHITGQTLHITQPSGSTVAITCSGVVSGSTSGFIIKGPLIILP
jgi:hypothetical protein